MAKAGRCLYCGTTIDESLAVAHDASRVMVPPELMFALEPRPEGRATGSKWLRRLIALGVAGVVLAVFVAQCMRM